MLVIRGGRSDILSAATMAAMAERHPGMQTLEVADQGHVPLLEGDNMIRRIVDFVAGCDSSRAKI
jgi:pimeloyl-ACP methyl ester carboxylesterase